MMQMQARKVLRDVALVALAAALGWWCHPAAVHAQRGIEGNLDFQFMPGGDQLSLSIYSPADRTIYVYPRVGTGNANVSCEYMFHVHQPGGAIQRENCRPGTVLP